MTKWERGLIVAANVLAILYFLREFKRWREEAKAVAPGLRAGKMT